MDQRYREQFFPKGVRGCDARVLYGEEREKERGIYLDYEVPELDSKRPFNYDLVGGKKFLFTTEKDRLCIQSQLMMTFLKSGRKFLGLGD